MVIEYKYLYASSLVSKLSEMLALSNNSNSYVIANREKLLAMVAELRQVIVST